MKLSQKITLITTAILVSLGVGVALITHNRNNDSPPTGSESIIQQTSKSSESEENSSTSEESTSSETTSASEEEIIEETPKYLAIGKNNLLIPKEEASGVEYTFTSTEDGYYTFHSLSLCNPENTQQEAYISHLADNQICYITEKPTLLYVEKDATVPFTVCVYDTSTFVDEVYSLELYVTQVAVADVDFPVSFVDGESVLSFYASVEGTYAIEVTEGAQVMEFKLEYLDFVPVSAITVYEPGQIFSFTVKSDTLTTATLLFSLVKPDEEEEEETPQEPYTASLGENTAELPEKYAESGINFTFTASDTATYIIETTDENCFLSWASDDGAKYGTADLDNASAFGLEAGETITINLSTQNHQADTLSFTIKQEKEYQPLALTEGTNTLKVKKANGLNYATYTFTADTDSNYLLHSYNAQSPDDAEENAVACAISYVVNEEARWVRNSQTLLSVQAGEVITFTAYVYDESLYVDDVYTLDLTITHVVLAGEQATITFVDRQATLCFYPTEIGKYTFTLTEGAQVMIYDPVSWGYVAVNYLIINESNNIYYIIIQSDTLVEAAITLTKL